MSTTVARLPALHAASAQVRWADGDDVFCRVGSEAATDLDENVSQSV